MQGGMTSNPATGPSTPEASGSAVTNPLPDEVNGQNAAPDLTSSGTAAAGNASPQGSNVGELSSSSASFKKPIKILMTNKHAATTTDPEIIASSRPVGLPLQFIDQQALRQSSSSDLRRVVRSHARRDADLKRQHMKATLNARSPRPLREKEAPKEEGAASSHNQAADGTAAASRTQTPTPTALRVSASDPIPVAEEPSNVSPPLQQLQVSSSNSDQLFNAPLIHGSNIQGLEWFQSSPIQSSGNQSGVIHAGHQSSFSHESPNTPTQSALFQRADEKQKKDDSLQHNGDIVNALVKGSWRHDPFDIHSDLNSPRAAFLLSHYNNIVSTVWVSGDKLVNFQTSRPGLLHATILFAASHLRALTNSTEYDRDILHHRGETIRIINSSLDHPSEQTSDQMIAALSSLILYEDSYGSKQTASIHRQGLQQILKLRYAKPELGIHRFVQHLLAYTPQTSQHLEERTSNEIDLNKQDTSSSLAQGTSSTPRYTALGQAITTFFLWFTSTAIQFESASYNPTDGHQIRQDIEEYLEKCPNYPKSKLSFGFRSWLLASMVYLHVAIVPPSDTYPLPSNEAEIVSQLKSVMPTSTTNPAQSENISISSPRLWILMINGLYSRSSDPVLLGSPEKLDLSTISGLHWCRAQLLLRDIPWAERRWKAEPLEDDWEWVQANGFWYDGVRRWSGQG